MATIKLKIGDHPGKLKPVLEWVKRIKEVEKVARQGMEVGDVEMLRQVLRYIYDGKRDK